MGDEGAAEGLQGLDLGFELGLSGGNLSLECFGGFNQGFLLIQRRQSYLELFDILAGERAFGAAAFANGTQLLVLGAER